MAKFNLDDFIGKQDIMSFVSLYETFNQKIFSIKDFRDDIINKEDQISTRQLIYWEKGELLDESETGYQRKSYSFIEYVWIRIIQTLRNYEVSMSVIKNLRKEIFEITPFSDILDEIKKTNPDWSPLIETLPDDERHEVLDLIHNGASDPEFVEFSKGFGYSVLELLLFNLILNKTHIALLVSKKEEVFYFIPNKWQEFFCIPEFVDFYNETHISISLTDIIKDFILSNDTEFISKNLKLITEREAKILELIRSQKTGTLTIQFGDKSDTVKITTSSKIKKEAKFLDLIMINGYQSINLEVEKGQIVSCKNTRKIKIQK